MLLIGHFLCFEIVNFACQFQRFINFSNELCQGIKINLVYKVFDFTFNFSNDHVAFFKMNLYSYILTTNKYIYIYLYIIIL